MSSEIIAINWGISMKVMDSMKGIKIEEIIGIIIGIKGGEDIQLLQGRFVVAAGRQRFGYKSQRNVTRVRHSGSELVKGA